MRRGEVGELPIGDPQLDAWSQTQLLLALANGLVDIERRPPAALLQPSRPSEVLKPLERLADKARELGREGGAVCRAANLPTDGSEDLAVQPFVLVAQTGRVVSPRAIGTFRVCARDRTFGVTWLPLDCLRPSS